ncbi:MAG: hypothetical protein HRT57_04840 [Crocinitomicaceae bacterium]|nr:hypothetical protein [Crocinitomicaceae bacterium]
MKIPSFILVLVLLVSCSLEVSDSISKEEGEKFPNVDLKDYKTVKFEEDFEILILKELSLSMKESERAILGYSHLSKEKHIYIERESIELHTKSLLARNRRVKSALTSFGAEHLKHFKGVLKKSTESKLEKSKVGKLDCLRSSFEGKSYGFPRTKFFTVWYFKTNEFIYALITWTIEESKDEFKDETLAMSLSFKED